MANLETIRLLRIKAVVEGLDKAAQGQSEVASAMAEVSKQGDILAEKLDKVSNRQLNGTKGWEAYLRATDQTFKAIDQVNKGYDKVIDSLNRKRISPQFAEQEFQRLIGLLDKVGVTREIAVKMDKMSFEQVRNQAQQVLGLRETVAAATAEAAKEQDRLNAKAKQYLEIIEPVAQAEARYRQELADIAKLQKSGALNPEQVPEAQAAAQRIRDNQIRAAGAGKGRLNRADMINLGYQFNDILQMGLMGANPAQIAVTQLPQIYQILANQQGGVIGGVKALGREFFNIVKPITIFGGTTLAVLGTATLAWTKYKNSILEVERATMGLGRSTMASTGQLNRIAEANAADSSLSIRDSRSAVAALASTGRIVPDLFADAEKGARDFAAITGQKLPDAMKDLAGALADPAKGAEELDKKFNLFNATQLKSIQRMAESGDRTGAQKAILQALLPVIQGAADKTGAWARSMEWLGKAADKALDTVGKVVDRVTNGPSDIEFLRQRAQDRARADQPPQTPAEARRRALQALVPLPHTEADLQESYRQENVRRQEQQRMAEARQAQAQTLSKDVEELLKGTDPMSDTIDQLTRKIDLLDRALKDTSNAVPSEVEKWKDAERFFREQRTLQETYKAFGGQQAYEGLRDSQFNVQVQGLTDFQRQLAELDKGFRERAQLLPSQIRDSAELAAAEESLRKERENAFEALRRQQQMGIAQQVAPEIFRERDLREKEMFFSGDRASLHAQGFDDKQIDLILGRLRTAIATLETPLQAMLHNYQLEQQSINAVTYAQKEDAEAARAWYDEIKKGNDVLQAATAAEIARANAVARSIRQAYDTARDSRDQARLSGMRPYEREQAQITQNFDRQRLESAPGAKGYLDAAEAYQKAAAAREAIIGPLRDAHDTVRETVEQAKIEAATYGQTAGAIAEATERQRLLNEFIRAGVPITEQLKANIDGIAKQAGEAAQYSYVVGKQNQTMDSLRDLGKDSLKGFISDLREGKSAGEAFLNVLNRIVDKLLDMMIDDLFDTKSGGKGGIFSWLMNGFKDTTAPRASPLSTAGVPGIPNIGLPQPTTVPLSKTITENIAGSLVPSFQGPVKQISSGITENLGRMYTTVNDGIRNEVEQYIRSGAMQRGMNPDIIAAGFNQESRFNPLAHNLNAREDSYGVAQLNMRGGLGVDAMRAGVDVRNPAAWRDQVDFSLDYMQQHGHGAWYGFRDVGIRDPWAGIPRPGTNTLRGGEGLDDLSNNVSSVNKNLDTLSLKIGEGSQDIGGAFQDTTSIIDKSGDGLGGAFQNAIQKLNSSGGGGGLGGLGNLFGGGGGGSSYGGYNLSDVTMGSDWSFSFHEGGKVGFGGGYRKVDPRVFLGAPRLHSGNLRPDERPIIAQTGEIILSRDNVKSAQQRGAQMQAQAAPTVMQPVVNVVNPPSQPEVRTNPDGSVDIMFERLENGLADRAARGRGTLVKSLGARNSGQALKG